MKLRKLRALRGQGNNVQQQPRPTSTSVSTDLEAIRSLFTEKEKELGMYVFLQCTRKLKKVLTKKLVKSNKTISQTNFLNIFYEN